MRLAVASSFFQWLSTAIPLVFMAESVLVHSLYLQPSFFSQFYGQLAPTLPKSRKDSSTAMLCFLSATFDSEATFKVQSPCICSWFYLAFCGSFLWWSGRTSKTFKMYHLSLNKSICIPEEVSRVI